MSARWWPVVSILLLAGLLVWVLLIWRLPAGDAPAAGGDFILQSASGPVSLSDFRGKVVVIYFGYTSCPDICPTSLALLSMALKGMPMQQQLQVQPLFISVDPERDTPQRLQRYVANFYPSLVGLGGAVEQVRQVAATYGVAYRLVRQEASSDYAVDHSSRLYLVDRQGRLQEVLPHATPAALIVESLRRWIGRPDSASGPRA